MIPLDEWKRAGRTHRHGAHELFYRVEGSGPALLCLHGFPSASWDWAPLWPALTARFRVVAADLLGFGYSDKPAAHEYSIGEQASLQESLLAELGIGEVHLLAHDYGDTVAQELLARAAERRKSGGAGLRVQSAVLLNGGLFPEAHRPRLVQRLLASPLGPLVGQLTSRRAFDRGLGAIFGEETQPSAELLDGLWSLLRYEDGHRVLHRLIAYMEERRVHRERWVGALVGATVPLRVIDGVVDPVSGAGMVARYRELVPNPDVVELAGIGHYPQIEAAERVLEAFLQFHDRLRAQA